MRGHLLVCCIGVSLLASCSTTPAPSPGRDALIDEFLERSYLHQEAVQASQQYAQQQNAKRAPHTSEADLKGRAFNRELEEALRPESTVPLMRDYLRSQRAETLEHMLVWLRNPLAQRMLTLAAQPFDYAGFNSYQVPKNELRYELIPRLDKATHTSELAIEDTTEKTKLLGPILMKKGESVPSDYKLAPMIAQFLQAQLLRKQAFIYQKASDQDLKQYVEFLESPLGQTYVAIRRNALVAAHSKAQAVMAKLFKGD
jgi:hypothetical protein